MATLAIPRIKGYRMWQPVGSQRKWGGVTPEIYFNKAIDNSRLVKVADPRRAREIKMFSASVALLFSFLMIYTWQHFSAIEYGYKIEAQRIQRDALLEQNRALHLEEASLRDPERIEQLANRMGLEAPQAGQVMHLEATPDPSAPVLAKMSEIQVVEMQR
ncbi:MAG TPA: cell division protein FtsL [Terriglobales bacterium]|nr:cell division protein FtsL [Terriglobales bacterium]